MDRQWSASAVAAELGTSVPRVARAARRLGFETGRGGRLALDSEQVARLRGELGVVSAIPGLTRSEVKVLAALGRTPLGLPSARAVARRAGLSPTAAVRAVKSLHARGLVRSEPTVIAAGRARRVTLLHANRRSEHWDELAPLLARVRKPDGEQRERRLPARLGHLFWNSAPAQLDVERGGPYIARRLLRTLDPDGLAWGARNLPAAAWREGARARGLTPDVRALAENLALADEVRPQHLLGPPEETAGLRVAGLKDLMAMKLKVLAERGELRDYYDVMSIEQQVGMSLEDGVAHYLDRYGLDRASAALSHLVRALGYLDDADEDDSLPTSKAELAQWWLRRQVELIRNLGQ